MLSKLQTEKENRCRMMFKRWSDAISAEKLGDRKRQQLKRYVVIFVSWFQSNLIWIAIVL
jgi:hypothetical protein